MKVSRKPARGGTPADVSLASSVDSQPYSVEFLTHGSIQAVWSGTPTGTLKLQVSNNAFKDNVGTDDSNSWNAGATWEDLPGSSCDTGGAAGHHMWELWKCGYEAIRVVYTRSAGTGTLNLYFIAKED